MHIILDFETLGQARYGKITYVAYTAFDPFKLVTFEDILSDIKTFKFNYLLEDQKQYNIAANTVDFWKRQPSHVKDEMIGNPVSGGSISEFIESFNQFVFNSGFNGSEDLIWARGPGFDIQIIERLYEDSSGSEPPFPFHRIRDVRTYLDAFNLIMNSGDISKGSPWKGKLDGFDLKFDAHNAKHDIAKDILQIQLATALSREINLG